MSTRNSFFGGRRGDTPSILVTNDDGVHSPGLLYLKQALERFGQVSVVAPDRNRTGAGRSITMRSPLWVEEVTLADGSRAFATDGTPVDCVRLAALGFLERPPDLIVAGINLGGNLGDDITYSGTVAAAFEGIMLDTPAIAFSAEGFHEGYDLTVPARFAGLLIGEVLSNGFPRKTLLNVNCPDLPWASLAGTRITRLGKRIYGDRVQLRETAGNRRRYFIYGDDLRYHHEQGTDFEAIVDGCVSITPIHFELTSEEALAELQGWDLNLSKYTRPGLRSRSSDEARGTEAGDLGGGAGASTVQPAPAIDAREGHSAEDLTRPLEPLPTAVIFDLDGTVVDSVELIVASFAHAVRTVLGSDLTRQELVAHVGMPLREQMALINEELADELVDAYREFNHREHDRMLRIYEGMKELLVELELGGIRLGLVTSKSRPTTEMAFRLTGIEAHFGAVVCAEDTERNKPYPDPLLLCLRLLGVRGDQAVYVGDSPYDLQAAHAAEMRAVAVTWGVFEREDLLAQEPVRLAESVAGLRRILGFGESQAP